MYKQGLVELMPIVLAGLSGSSRLGALLTQKQWLEAWSISTTIFQPSLVCQQSRGRWRAEAPPWQSGPNWCSHILPWNQLGLLPMDTSVSECVRRLAKAILYPCEDSGEVSWAELCHHAWRTSYVPDALANADWLVYLAWATPAEIMLGIFLGINDYFHCQDIFHQVQLPPVRNYGQGKVIWSVVNVYVWTWEFMFCGPAKLIKLQF